MMAKSAMSKTQPDERKAKKVNWAESPPKFSSYEDSIKSSQQPSSRNKGKGKLRSKLEDSIGESIRIEESYDAFGDSVKE